jgi:hypothetical protein
MIKVYLANRPPPEYREIDSLDQILAGEINRIATETGNHWRKIFNVYAKLIHCLRNKTDSEEQYQYSTWQLYRDNELLQAGSDTELHFDRLGLKQEFAQFSQVVSYDDSVKLIMGKGFADQVLAEAYAKGLSLIWLDSDFAINRELNLIVCPYFDYRQLSNIKIEFLVDLILGLE